MEEDQIIVDVGLDAFIASLRHLQKQYELNTAALKAMKDAGEEQSDAYITLTQEQKVLRQQMASTEKAMQNEIKMQQAQDGSLVQLRAQLANLQKQYDSMSGMERMGEAGEELQGRIKALHDQILGLEGDTGRMQRNVGNYPEAMKPVTAQLREMTQQLVQLKMEGKENTEEYNELLKKTGEIKDAMMDAQNEVKQMASDTSTLNSVLAGAQAAAGAFSVALGIMNLTGDKDSETAKELAEAQRKLQSAIAITTGLQALQNALQKESALMMGVNKIRILAAAAAQKAYAAATRDAEAAQAVFNKVAKSNIYVWLAGVILSVVGAIAAFTRGSKEQQEETRKVNEELKTQLEYLHQLDEMYSALGEKAIKDAQYQLDRAKASGKSTEEIRKYEDKLFNARLANLEKLEEELGYSRQEHNRLQWEYEHQLQEYEDGVRRMAENAGKVPEIVTQISQAALDEQKKHLDETKGILDQFDKLYEDRKTLQNEQAEREAQRRREDEEAAKRAAEEAAKIWRENAQAIRDANKALIEAATADELYKKGEENNAKLAQSFQEVADRVGLFAEELKDLPAPKDIPFISDEGLTDSTSQLELFAESYKDNAQAIQETSSALESSFSSLSQMYQQMANDESKTEEERAKAARKAKAWAGIQIAANAGAAVAKGVASAVDVGFPAAIPAMATMTATILSAIAQAKALLAEAHEHGGVIGGKFVGATSGSDNVLMTGRRGELVLNAEQQKRLYDIANGSASSNLTASLVEALQAMPAPVLVYSELKRFENNVNILDELSNLN